MIVTQAGPGARMLKWQYLGANVLRIRRQSSLIAAHSEFSVLLLPVHPHPHRDHACLPNTCPSLLSTSPTHMLCRHTAAAAGHHCQTWR